MKKIYMLVLIAMACLKANSQCIPNPDWNKNGINPSRLSDGEIGVVYNSVITFKINKDTSIEYGGTTYDVEIDSAKVVDVKNYPAGFNYNCNVSSCTWPGGGKGCVVFAGMPTILHSYHYEIKLFVKTYFKIKGLDQQLNRIDSSIIDYYTAGKSGVNENVLRQAFNMYPNPAKTSVEIELGNMASEDTEIIIYDVAGKILIKKATLSNDKQLIDLSALPKGLYFVAVSGNEKQQTQKLILN